MRRLLVLALGLLGLVLPASAGAAINTSASAGEIANSIAASGVSDAAFEPVLPAGTTATAVSDTLLGGFPIEGSTYGILTNGNAALAANAQGDLADVGTGSTATERGPTARDVTVLRIDLNVPEGVNCLTIGFRFLSEEYPDFVGGAYNDAFIAEVDPGTSGWTANADFSITAPKNFAFDAQGDVISVNTSGVSQMSVAEAAGTIYGGATPRLTAAQAITPGAHSLYLSLFDQQDTRLDSAVFVDRVALVAAESGTCVGGAQSDAPPAVTLGVSQSAPDDATPTLSGTAGAAPGDGNAVTVRLYPGGAAAGTPVQTLGATRSGNAWSVDAAALAPGTYTAQAAQSDVAGNTGLSAPATFTVAAPQVVGRQGPVPVLGKSVVASRVSGTIRVKTRRGKFRRLRAGEAIPLGSTVDATKGKVRITSAAGPGGATQSALFFQGAFVITQTGGSKPVTQLALSPKLSCPSNGKKARTSAKKKKVRRLWGDGKGRFRTKGRHGAATVRGTKWLTQDTCSGTLVRVKRGAVTVRDFAKKKTVVVKKGRTYVARPRKK